MKDISWIEVGAGCVTLFIVGLITSIFTPLSFAAGGYLTGWLLADLFSFAGLWIVAGARNFGFEIQLSALPVMGAFLAFVGAFFKSTQTNNNKAK